VRGADEKVQVEGPELTVLEGSKTVEHQGFVWSSFGSKPFVEEQTVAAKPFSLELQGSVCDTEFSTDLS